jgi:L-threonylcarbamoyladenylate synthase
MLAPHYVPRTPLRINAADIAPGEALLPFGPDLPPGADAAAATLNLSVGGDPPPTLFSHLRRIAVAPIPGEAINYRLRHAAVPRETPARPHGSG